MRELKQRLAAELPHLEAALARAADTLPVPARPAATHILNAGGKRLRPFLTVMTARLLGYTGDDIYPLAVTMEMLHAATLLHDDVLDNADTRRGKAAAHTRFGVTATILAGDALLAAANLEVARHNDTRLCACFAEATMQTASGEIMEIAHMGDVAQADTVYTDVVRGKTAWLLRASCTLGALKAGAGDAALAAAGDCGEHLGMAFQLVDDALDFAPEHIIGKPSGGDLREGKLTPPVRMYRDSLDAPARAAFDAAFANGGFSDAEAARIGALICERGFDTATRAIAGDYLHRACAALDILPDGPEKIVLRQMADYIQNRES